MISVCLASFNGEKYIKDQLLSVLCQLSKDDELIIADDGSVDNTLSIISSFGDSRVKLIKSCGETLGVIKNFERALNFSTGNYIFLCDQDDVWLPGKISSCMEILKENLMVVSDCTVVDNNLNIINPSFFALRRSGKGSLKNLWRNSYLGCCMAFRRELLSIALPIPQTVPMHDMWLGLLADLYGDVVFLPMQLSLYRRHTTAVSPTAGKSGFGFLKMIQFRLVLLFNLFIRAIFIKNPSLKIAQR